MREMGRVTMRVVLPAELYVFIQGKITGGQEQSASEVIESAVREQMGREQGLELTQCRACNNLKTGHIHPYDVDAS